MPNSSFQRYGLALFVLAWLMPNHFRPWVNFHSEALAMVSMTMLAIFCVADKQIATLFPKNFRWLSLLILLPWVQFALSINYFAGDALISSMFTLALLGAIFVGYSYTLTTATTAKLLLNFFHALWITALVSAAIGLLQWLELEHSLNLYAVNRSADGRAMANLAQPNQLATLLLIGIASLLFVYEKKAIGRFALLLGVMFMSFVMVLSQSRTALISVLVMSAFLVWKGQRCPLRITKREIVVWAVFCCLMTLLLPYLNSALMLANTRAIAEPDAVSERVLIWQQIIYAISQSPWFGYGWNQTATAQIAGVTVFPGTTPVNYAHNFVLDMLVWNGIPIGIFLTGVIGYWFFTRAKKVNRTEAVLAMCILLAVSIHSMLEYPFAYAYFLLTVGALVGVVEACNQANENQQPSFKPLNKTLVGGVLAVWVVIGSYFMYEYWLVEEDFRVARFESLKVGKTPAEYQVPHIRMSTQLAAMLNAVRRPPVPGMTEEELENLRQVALRFSYGPPTFRYALALGLNNDPAGAIQQMAVVRGLYGEKYYQATKAHLLALQEEKYPQLESVILP